MSRVLVIGGNLFIGYELVKRLLERSDEVTILHRGLSTPFGERVANIRCDRNDTKAITRTVRDGAFEYVFDNVYDWERGTTGEQVRAAAAACGPGLRRYVFMSSCAAYGEGLDREEGLSPLAGPDNPEVYCRNKADSERALAALYAEEGVETVSLRPPYIYGPRNPFYREQFFWDRMARRRPIIVPGDGSRLMQFVFVRDLVDAAILAAESECAAGKAYNVAHPEPMRQDEFVRALGVAAGVEPELRYVPRETLEILGGGDFTPPHYFGQYFDRPPITMDISLARRDLGFQPTSHAQALSITYGEYVATDRPSPDFSFDDRVLRGGWSAVNA